ncbi:MAG: tRNA uridine-5-carboxymethylaminomethyl(34) synthesis GTPase MnmE, partial [Sphingomonadales bacterium]|nr:tRNA uridine-5-carboxymethylaminomethyl(34) synthesis GTPase MnmE [Sphingomonadales bacterium]
MTDTIAALSTGRPPAALAIVRTSGPSAHAIARRLAGDLPPSRCASLRTLRNPLTGMEIDTAIMLRFDASASPTGENIVVYQCHGGRAVVDALLDALTSTGELRLAE